MSTHTSRTIFRFLVALPFLTLLCVGCSKEPKLTDRDDEPTTDAGAERVDTSAELEQFQEFADKVIAATCEKSFECCDASQREELGIGVDSADQCDTVDSTGAQIDFQFERDAIRSGNVDFDEGLGELCLESFLSRGCDEVPANVNLFDSREYRGCSEAITPTLPKGDPCKYHRACRTGYCKRNSGSSPDRCQPPPGAGEPCPQLTCAAGLFCDDFGEEPVCRRKFDDGEDCEADRQCQSERCSRGTCAAKQAFCGGS